MKKTKLGAFALAAILACPFGVGGISASAETWATNFKGIITETEEDGTVYKNYYINKNEWIIGDNVIFPNYSSTKEKDYIRFFDGGNRSLFGPRVRYEDFVCRFTVIMDNINLAEAGASLGLSFNRKTLYSYANDCPGILFMKAEAGTAVRVTQGKIDQTESGTIWLQYKDENALNLWEKSGEKYDFMVVKSGDTAQLYYAKAGDEAGLKVLRATVSGVSGEGFVAMCGIMGVNFQLDNFGVWSLNDSNAPLSDYTQNGAVGICKDQAVIGHGGSLLSANAYSDASVSYDVKVSSGSAFACTLGDEFVHFSADGSIMGSKGLVCKQSEKVNFSAISAVRLRKMGATVYVDVDDGKGYEARAIFTMREDKQVKFGVKAGADATIIVNTPAIVSLAGTMEIATKDYDPNVDVDPMAPKDISFNEYYGVK